MQTDYVQRFLFEELDIRGRLTCLTGAWQRMLDGRDYPRDVASLLGHTTALNVLLGANQKGAGRVTLQVQGSGPVKLLVADCTSELRIRGMTGPRVIEVFSDYVCPWCYLGSARVARLQKEHGVQVRFVHFPLHPDTPAEGKSLEALFAGRGYDIPKMQAQMRARMVDSE